jgi:heme a synthase
MQQLNPRQAAVLPYVRIWLFAVAFLVFTMVIVGGATRLTDSGLSITEWQPLLGIVPPLSQADWLEVFEKYKLIPEYSVVNQTMTLEDFKVIFWWEWAHRLLGRIIGAAFLVPFLFFALFGRLARQHWPRFIGIFILGSLQGGLGWYMVASGLVDRVDVSQYRLSAHLTLASVIFAAILWVAFGLSSKRRKPATGREAWAFAIVALILLQVAAGGFVAGLDAGMAYNNWPLMDGKLVPDGLLAMQPAWRNLFENAMTVQFDHRLLAYLIAVVVALHAYIVRSDAALLLLGAVLLQIGLGIWTLLAQVPLALGLIHQAGAQLVLAAAVWNLHAMLSRSPVPDRR